MAKHSIFQGDTPNIRRVRFDSITPANSTCRQVVRRTLSATPEIDQFVTGTVTFDGFSWFQVALSPAQTTGLAAGVWLWVVELAATGTVPPLNRELHDVLDVQQQGAP